MDYVNIKRIKIHRKSNKGHSFHYVWQGQAPNGAWKMINKRVAKEAYNDGEGAELLYDEEKQDLEKAS